MLSLNQFPQVCTHIVELNRKLLPRAKSTKERMLLVPESGIHHNIHLKNRVRSGERTYVLPRPDPLDSSVS
jgi:hypothetical protein